MTLRRRRKPFIDASFDPVLLELVEKKVGLRKWYSLHDVHSVLNEMVHLMAEEEEDQGPEGVQTHWQQNEAVD